MQLDEGGLKQLDSIFSRYARALPRSVWANKADRVERKGKLKTDRVRTALRNHISMLREIMETVHLNAKDLANLRGSMNFLVPIPR